jgi:NADH:ubiquinone oxidoreductase subunit C
MSEERPTHGDDAPAQVRDVQTIPVHELLARVQEAADRKLRFVTATCFDSGNDYELYYHFADGPTLTHLRVIVAKGTPVPSISGIYMCAFLVENEIKELFGVPITDIVIDYKGRLLLTEGGPVTPMLKQQVSRTA